MKRLCAGLTLISASLVASALLVRPPAQASAARPQTSRTPVVVELFTSEGCSSCPPADALLARLADEQVASNVQLIALEEHVDYWNDLGWVDPFSSRDWTSRQYAYAGALGNGNAYTPQMVVDGTVEFVGSHTKQARETILKAANSTKIPVILAQSKPDGADAVGFSAKVGRLEATTKGDSSEVWLAITETALHSAVTRGENAGEDLHHAAIVRAMRKIGEAKAGGETSFVGDASVPLKREWKRENLRAVLFVQEKKSRRILGAAEIRFSE
jgi:hypothetical protein